MVDKSVRIFKWLYPIGMICWIVMNTTIAVNGFILKIDTPTWLVIGLGLPLFLCIPFFIVVFTQGIKRDIKELKKLKKENDTSKD